MNDYMISLATSSGRELQAVFLLVLFVAVIAAAYYVTNVIARVQKGKFRGRNLEIIEAISVGPQKSVQLVRVGKQYMVIGVSKNEINMLQTLGEDDIVINDEVDYQSVIPFKNILGKYVKKEEGDSGDDHHETKDE